ARRASVPRIATAVVGHNVGRRSVAEGKNRLLSKRACGTPDGLEGFGKPESHSGSRRSTVPKGATDRRRKKRACLAWGQEAVGNTVVQFVRENRIRVKRTMRHRG